MNQLLNQIWQVIQYEHFYAPVTTEIKIMNAWKHFQPFSGKTWLWKGFDSTLCWPNIFENLKNLGGSGVRELHFKQSDTGGKILQDANRSDNHLSTSASEEADCTWQSSFWENLFFPLSYYDALQPLWHLVTSFDVL